MRVRDPRTRAIWGGARQADEGTRPEARAIWGGTRDEVDRVRKPPRRKGGLPFCLGRGGGGGEAASPGGLEWGSTRGEGGTPAILGKGEGEAASPGDLVRG